MRATARRLLAGDAGALAAAAAGAPLPTATAVATRQRPVLRVYNSLRRGVEPLVTADAAGPITWYSCGPTVYDSAHLGHGRTYVCLDVMRRVTARLTGRPVLYAMGVTDVDDKIVARARERGVPFADLARRYEAEFWEDMAALGVAPPTVVTRVTDHIGPIVEYVRVILERGGGYVAPDGSGVYLDTQALGPHGYGKLMPSARHADDWAPAAAAAAGDDADGADASPLVPLKRNRRDFALWKAAKSADEPSWPSPWGPGRPGWHIECSAMTDAVFGGRLDVHAGGVDLAFPHHCNEIAQCEAHAGYRHHGGGADDGAAGWDSPWCRTFLHTGHVHIAGAKMSKSLKNFITVRAMLAGGSGSGGAPVSPDAFRLFCLAHRYRSAVTYSEDRLRDGAAWLGRVGNIADDALAALGAAEERRARGASSSGGDGSDAPPPLLWRPDDWALLERVGATGTAVEAALADDFDTPGALAALSDCASALHGYVKARGPGAQPGLLRQALGLLGDEMAALGLGAGAALRDRLARPPLPAQLRVSSSSAAAAAGAADGAAAEDAVRRLTGFRDAVRGAAAPLSKAAKAEAKQLQQQQQQRAAAAAASAGSDPAAQGSPLLDAARGTLTAMMAACDAVRDVDLPALGWRVKDSAAGAVLTRLPACSASGAVNGGGQQPSAAPAPAAPSSSAAATGGGAGRGA
jgi:cysteinyl-tRNA synthetase